MEWGHRCEIAGFFLSSRPMAPESRPLAAGPASMPEATGFRPHLLDKEVNWSTGQ